MLFPVHHAVVQRRAPGGHAAAIAYREDLPQKVVTLVLLFTTVMRMTAAAEVAVPSANIVDHTDSKTTGSLAWQLARCRVGDKVLLADPGPYVLHEMLSIPPGVSLTGRAQGDSVLKAGAGLLEGTMIRLNNNSVLANLTIDGDHWPCHLVMGSGIASATVERCQLRNTLSSTRHPPTPPAALRCHGLVFHQCANITIRSNTIENIGYPTTVPVVAAGIYAEGNRGLHILGNRIRYTLSAGIDFTGSQGAMIADNTIYRNGRNRELGSEATADGITAYHNLADDTRFVVVRNTITESGNHGIHVSGRDCRVEENTIYAPAAQGILLGDQYTPPDDCRGSVVRSNRVVGLKSGGNRHAIFIYNNLPSEVVIQANVPADVYYRK
jgi:hypothetical protein